ncbi:coiled-coil domain-containing protein 12-like isoform X2 [Clytia hemisphaerica]|uniref:coiled-coil domain-containing protein 12-like isoform X2 n=1 Tax=Clytia hemisphaerica TaxID=252671 RepID=UPI0034D4424C
MTSKEPPKKILKFRNYAPKDEQLKEKKVEKVKPIDAAEGLSEHLEKAKDVKDIEEVNIATLAPRKPDWDLKRDVAKKLDKLEKRTQKAIIELIRDRLKGEENLADAVNTVGDN